MSSLTNSASSNVTNLQQKIALAKADREIEQLKRTIGRLEKELLAAHETIENLNNSHAQMSDKHDSLQQELEKERTLRLEAELNILRKSTEWKALEAKLKSDAFNAKERLQIERKEKQIQEEQLKSTKNELTASIAKQAELSAMLERARLMAKTAKAQLDKLNERKSASGE